MWDDWDDLDDENNKWTSKPPTNEEIKKMVHEDMSEYTYQELYFLSENLDPNLNFKWRRWNLLKVSTFDKLEQIFYDIAYSKEAKKLYRKINLISIAYCFLKILPILYFVFTFMGYVISNQTHFLTDTKTWKIMFLLNFAIVIYHYMMNYLIFKHYSPVNLIGKINRSKGLNRTSNHKVIFRWGIRRTYYRNSTPRSRYNIFTANNGKKYLIDIEEENRNYSIRNWYLISKYITCNKMTINDLPSYFEDDLFVYLTTEKFQKLDESPKKLKCFLVLIFHWILWLNIIFEHLYFILLFSLELE